MAESLETTKLVGVEFYWFFFHCWKFCCIFLSSPNFTGY
jgi:hypothetical protein